MTLDEPTASTIQLRIDYQRRRSRACPALSAIFRGASYELHGGTRVIELERLQVQLRCRCRPGTSLAPDYVLDLCLGRAYAMGACVFGPDAPNETAESTHWPDLDDSATAGSPSQIPGHRAGQGHARLG